MAPAAKERSLEQTPTWAVAVVCFILVLVSIIIEYIIHLIGKVRIWTCTCSKYKYYISQRVYESDMGFCTAVVEKEE